MRRLFLFLYLVLISGQLQAARVWLYENVYVEDVSTYTVGSNVIMQVKLKDYPNNTGCAPADAHGVVYMNTTGDFNANWQLQYSTFLSAQAQGLPIDVLVDDAICNTSSGWYDFGSPAGLGFKFYGVRLDGE